MAVEIGMEELVQLALEAAQLLGIIRGDVDHAVQEHAPYELEDIAANGTDQLIDPVHGLAALHAQIAQISGQLDAVEAAITAAVTPVTLPAAPPAGWTDAGAEAVWLYPLEYTLPAYTLLERVFDWVSMWDDTAVMVCQDAPWFARWQPIRYLD
jgi:hypothetical protein